MSSRKWDYYKPGQIIRDAKVKILEVVEQSYLQRDTVYRVKRLCCGTVREMTHCRIRERESKKPQTCNVCRCPGIYGKYADERDVVPKVDMAPPPPSALKLPRGWMPR